MTMITRLRLDAALYEPAAVRRPRQNGRPRLKGKRLPTLSKRLIQATTHWCRSQVAWYGGKLRWVELTPASRCGITPENHQ